MNLGQLSAGDLAKRLAGPGLAIRTGPFNLRVRSDISSVTRALALMYEGHQVVDDSQFCDCTLELTRPQGLRRWVRPQVQIRFDGRALFEPMPLAHAYPLLEWTMNWWISGNAHQYLILHAAVVERDGCAAILPAPPGSGKSTLCAGLVQRGWRLLSDELGLILLDTGEVCGLGRPISLKNESLRVIRAFAPGAVLSAEARDTAKGTVAQLKPGTDDVARADEPARPRWVVFPRYVPGADAELVARPKADAMMELGRNAFNYALLGQAGFEVLADTVSASACFDFSYSRLDDAVAVFDDLFQRRCA